MSFLAVLPSIVPSWTKRCLATIRFDRRSLLLVDNATNPNLGVPASWNLGADLVLANGIDWLWIISASMRFGEQGGLDMVAMMRNAPPGTPIVEAQNVGWHCIALRRQVFQRVGLFDENFFPAYYEDNDMGYRVIRGGLGTWPSAPIDATCEADAHGVRLGPIPPFHYAALYEYYQRKWGGLPGEETFDTPFGADAPLSEWPTPPTIPWAYQERSET